MRIRMRSVALALCTVLLLAATPIMASASVDELSISHPNNIVRATVKVLEKTANDSRVIIEVFTGVRTISKETNLSKDYGQTIDIVDPADSLVYKVHVRIDVTGGLVDGHFPPESASGTASPVSNGNHVGVGSNYYDILLGFQIEY
ncbi:MAG: hypothetical protein FWG37_00595 [Clostridia bacterium]|nr:hypothetical protein [Clostridia bacterium]